MNTTPAPKPPRGRPRINPQGTSVSAWVTPSEYDRLAQLARQQEKSLSALVRELLAVKRP